MSCRVKTYSLMELKNTHTFLFCFGMKEEIGKEEAANKLCGCLNCIRSDAKVKGQFYSNQL